MTLCCSFNTYFQMYFHSFNIVKICIDFFDWPSEPNISQKYNTGELRLGKNPD